MSIRGTFRSCRFLDVSQQGFGSLLEAIQAGDGSNISLSPSNAELFIVFMALRIYAINDRKWFWTVLILILGLIPGLSNIIVG